MTAAPEKERMEVNFGQSLEEVRKKADAYHIPVPQHRMTPLKQNWEIIVKTIVEHMKLQIRMNTKRKVVEIRVCHLKLVKIAICTNTEFSGSTESSRFYEGIHAGL